MSTYGTGVYGAADATYALLSPSTITYVPATSGAGAAMNVYDKGDSAVLTATFRTPAGALTDPTIVKFRAVDPAGVITNWTYGVDAQIAKASTGVYVATLVLPTIGVWAYHWTTEAGTVEDGAVEVVELSTARSVQQQVARARLVRLLSPELEPVLTDADIDDLLSRARRIDAAGLLPSETGWVPTWAVEAAAAEGWELRASRCFGDINFAEDGQRFDASQRFRQCLEMAKLYSRGATSGTGSGSARVPSIVST